MFCKVQTEAVQYTLKTSQSALSPKTRPRVSREEDQFVGALVLLACAKQSCPYFGSQIAAKKQ